MFFSDSCWKISGKMLFGLVSPLLIIALLATPSQARDTLKPLSQADIDGYLNLF